MRSDETTAVAPQRQEYNLKERREVIVWHELLRHQKHSASFGIVEPELMKATGLSEQDVRFVMRSLIDRNLVTVRLQQVGTAGTCDVLYTIRQSGYELILKYPLNPEASVDGK